MKSADQPNKTLILIRHSLSKLDPNLPPQQWGLTDQGRERCIPLASQLERYKPEILITSIELKANQTGKIVANKLGIHCEIAAGLHEHDREPGRILHQDKWRQQISSFFSNPDSLIFGKETANQALERFSEAVESIMKSCSHTTIAIASHGTVMSLLYGKISGANPFNFWQKLRLPAFYVVNWPEYRVTSQRLSSETF
jgi:broad specificity phosphatase PhoE